MEGAAVVQSPRRERRRPSFHSPNSSRAVSRSGSTRNSSARMPPQANSDSSLNILQSPTLRYAQPPSSRFSNRRGSMGSNADRPPTPVSKSSVRGSQSSSHQEPASTLLQEKLQRERRSEIQRNLNRLASEMDAAAADTKAVATTPERCATADGKRPGSGDANGDGGNQKGFAVKEMEQAMTTLHKQNFDLKLELFHRRQRQSVLEERVEALEAEKVQIQETNDTLIQELERRDKAVEEAVTMIVTLEARMELLLREREMLRQVEADRAFVAKMEASELVAGARGPLAMDTQDGGAKGHGKTLGRMPSFLSERTENTENLRNVYLGAQGSILSLSKTDPRAEHGGFVSPSMSILSESSFLSIYGREAAPHALSSPHDYGADYGGRRSLSVSMNDPTPTRSSAKQAIESGETTSPLQKLEKLDPSTAARQGSEAAPLGTDIERAATIKPLQAQPLRVRKTRNKPASTRRVITDVPTSRAHALPPTPDTMSGSINQSLCSDEAIQNGRDGGDATYPVLSRATMDQTDEMEPGHWRFKTARAAHPPSITAFTGRKDHTSVNYYDMPLTLPRRPRSADETTISRHRIDWDSEGDLDDAASEVSSFDQWMREGLRPSRGGQPQAQRGVTVPQRHTSRGTPDLFGFPSDSNGWQSNDMFGALGGNGYYGAAAPLAPALDALGASLPAPEAGTYGSGLAGASSPRAPGHVVAPPPAPHRKSSLRARTSAPGTPMTTRPPRLSGKHGESELSRKSSLTGQSQQGNANRWTAPTPRSITPTQPDHPQAQHQEENPVQKRHYPPTASQQQQQATARPRSRGIANLFRRSLGSSHIPLPSASVPNNQSPFPPPSKADPAPSPVGVPTWERRNEQGGDEMSATPPPILRKRAPVSNNNDAGGGGFADAADPQGGISRPGKPPLLRSSSPGLGAGLSSVLAAQQQQQQQHDGGGGVSLAPGGQDQGNGQTAQASAPPGQGGGHGRKWFGLGRVTGPKNSAS